MLSTRPLPNILILKGSPRKEGNTAHFAGYAKDRWAALGCEVREIDLVDLTIAPCQSCYRCQDVPGAYGCVIRDDMDRVVEAVLWSDVMVLATPIFIWYCPAEMKAMLDRFFGMNKYYRSAPEERLWAGRGFAIIATSGYDPESAAKPFEMGIRHLCEHSKLPYYGMTAHRDIDDLASFTTDEAREKAEEFARSVVTRYSEIRRNQHGRS